MGCQLTETVIGVLAQRHGRSPVLPHGGREQPLHVVVGVLVDVSIRSVGFMQNIMF